MELGGGDLARSLCAFRGKWLLMCCWAHKDPYDAQRWDRAPVGAPSVLKEHGGSLPNPWEKPKMKGGLNRPLGSPPEATSSWG